MNQDIKKERIIFLDLLRAFAVVNMIQGHTLDVILSNQYRTSEYLLYSIWHFNRGITAPIFMFTAGAVFSYIFLRYNLKFSNNPRVKIGIRRSISLIIIGYFMKIPSNSFLSFEEKTAKQLMKFFSVDVLQLIGIGLLLIIIIFYICQKFKINRIYAFIMLSVLIVIFTPLAERTKWEDFTPLFLAGYMNKNIGSNFPVFPYVIYMLIGASFGSFLSKRKEYCKTKKFSFSLLITGFLLITAYIFLDKIRFALNDNSMFLSMRSNLVSLRVGIVLIFVSSLTLISRRITNLHWSVNLLARNSLSIYVIHLFILYGSAWNRGIIYYYGKSIGPYFSVIYCIIFVCMLMIFCGIYERLTKTVKTHLKKK